MSRKEENHLAPLEARIKGFNEELMPLLGKYKLGLMARPVFTPDGRVLAQPQLFDDSKPKEPEPPGEKVEGGLAKVE